MGGMHCRAKHDDDCGTGYLAHCGQDQSVPGYGSNDCYDNNQCGNPCICECQSSTANSGTFFTHLACNEPVFLKYPPTDSPHYTEAEQAATSCIEQNDSYAWPQAGNVPVTALAWVPEAEAAQAMFGDKQPWRCDLTSQFNPN